MMSVSTFQIVSADGGQPAIVAELAQHMHILGIAHAALDEADIARAAALDVGQRRTVEFHQLDQIKQALVHVQQRHVAAEAAGERGHGDSEFGRNIHCERLATDKHGLTPIKP